MSVEKIWGEDTLSLNMELSTVGTMLSANASGRRPDTVAAFPSNRGQATSDCGIFPVKVICNKLDTLLLEYYDVDRAGSPVLSQINHLHGTSYSFINAWYYSEIDTIQGIDLQGDKGRIMSAVLCLKQIVRRQGVYFSRNRTPFQSGRRYYFFDYKNQWSREMLVYRNGLISEAYLLSLSNPRYSFATYYTYSGDVLTHIEEYFVTDLPRSKSSKLPQRVRKELNKLGQPARIRF